MKKSVNYENLKGMKWGDISKELQGELLAKCNVWNDLIFDEEDIIIDLTDNLSVAAKINLDSENVNDFTIDYNSILYDPTI